MKGWFGQPKKHSEASELGWKRRGKTVKTKKKSQSKRKTKKVFQWKNASTWRLFNKRNMGPAMKHYGGHGPAIRAMGKEWTKRKKVGIHRNLK